MNRTIRIAWAGGVLAMQNHSAYARTEPLSNISFSETFVLPGQEFALHGVKPHNMKTRSIFGIMHPLTMWWKIKVKMQREPLYCAAMYKVPNASAQKKAHFVFRIQVVDEELNAEDIRHLFFEKMNVWLKWQIGSTLDGLRGGEILINALNLTLRQGDELIFEFLPEGAFNVYIDSGTGPCIAAKITSPVIAKALQSCFFGRVIDFWHERTKDL